MSESHDYMKHLQEVRQKAWHEAKEMLERAGKENRDLTAEEQSKFDKINSDIDERDAQIRSLLEREQRDNENDVAREEWAKIVRPEITEKVEARQQDDFQAFLRGEGGRSFDLDIRGVAREKMAIRAGARGDEFRVAQEDVATAGGNTVPTSFLRSLYDFIEVYSGVRRLNVTVLTTSSGEALEIPKVTTHGTAALVGEGTALASADPKFGKTTLNAWKYGQLVQVSSELLADSGVDVLGFLAKDMGRALGRVTDTAYISGSGSSAPAGLTTTLGTGATAQTGATGVPSYGNIIDLIHSVNEEYRMAGAQWLTSDANAGKIRKILDTQNRPLWEPSWQVGQPDRLLGYEVVTDPNIAAFATPAATAKPMAFGDFSGFYIRDVGSIRLERSDEFAFDKDLVTWRAVLRTDSDLIDLTGCAKLLVDPTT